MRKPLPDGNCKNGHQWAEHGRPNGNKWRCAACKRERAAAVAHQRVLVARCECGNKKLPNAVGCLRCRFLDGEGPRQHDAISYLEDGPATPKQVADALGYRDDRYGLSAATYLLERLYKNGRVKRVRGVSSTGSLTYLYGLTLAGLPGAAVPAVQPRARTGVNVDERVVEAETPEVGEQAGLVAA